MIVTAYKTHKVRAGDGLFKILDDYLPKLEEKSVVVIVSKIISICQKNIVDKAQGVDKAELVKEEADLFYIDENLASFGTLIPTIKNNILIANAGVDESNVEEGYLLWPHDIEKITDKIWKYLRTKHHLKALGVVITDSRLSPLVYGVTGVGIAWSGFKAVQDYRGTDDIFGHKLKMTFKGVLNGFAAAAVVVTGEGNEQTPLAVIQDVPFVTFQNRPPTKEERNNMQITMEDDIYGKMLNAVAWEKGKKKV